ncbi:hypothetical protein KBX31_03345 [Liquorilactobacillus satsumensis]|uniref:hypothetical protein n=1 Tax=Liquorilactobacillus satsumensis TaxID=259059 RepID=UPI0021C365B5|nr:hypothetical protein [Liquorilactobacillus satsumensis]MCP9312336.1 hypothetical protein [Liquorilactobacillus satsumensis]MCP9327689.1 hypothetical protein [Liquorilactobacillus satsumensis]MCP9359660.1 hypothetical protein [Liquorilactobacillus satsumensis]
MKYSNLNTFIQSEPSELLLNSLQIDVNQVVSRKKIMLTCFSDGNLKALLQAKDDETFFVGFDFFTLLQKLQRFNLIPPLTAHLKILPEEYPQKIAEFTITVYKNDDSLYGALTVFISEKNTNILYCAGFTQNGAHQKRIKTWKKVARKLQLAALILNSQMRQPNASQQPFSENGIQKHFGKVISQLHPSAKLVLSPWNPERLQHFNEIANSHEKALIWTPNFAHLIHFFYPQEVLLTSKDTHTAAALLLVDPTQDSTPQKIDYLDPTLQAKALTAGKYQWTASGNFNKSLTFLDEIALKELKDDLQPARIIFLER